jgi:hypothetical protein
VVLYLRRSLSPPDERGLIELDAARLPPPRELPALGPLFLPVAFPRRRLSVAASRSCLGGTLVRPRLVEGTVGMFYSEKKSLLGSRPLRVSSVEAAPACKAKSPLISKINLVKSEAYLLERRSKHCRSLEGYLEAPPYPSSC